MHLLEVSVNSVVLVREVWDTRDLIGEVVDADGQIRSSLFTRFEPEDLNALEMALQIKDDHGGEVTVVSLGESRDVDVLREALYRDVDNVIRLEDTAFANLDTLGMARAFSQVIQKIGDAQLVLTGISIPEGESAFLGNQVAGLLGYPHASYVDALDAVDATSVICKRGIEGGYETVKLALPAVLVVGVALQKDDPRTPRSAKARLKLKNKKTKIPVWAADELGLSATELTPVTSLARYEAVPQREIATVEIDSEDAAALRSLVAEWRTLR